MEIIAALRISHMHHNAAKEAECVDSRLAIRLSCIFPTDHWAVEHGFAPYEIQPMPA